MLFSREKVFVQENNYLKYMEILMLRKLYFFRKDSSLSIFLENLSLKEIIFMGIMAMFSLLNQQFFYGIHYKTVEFQLPFHII